MTESSSQVGTRGPQRVSLADWVETPQAPARREPFTLATFIKIAVVGLLFVAVVWPLLPGLVRKWLHDTDWTHCFVIPLFSLYLLYARRDDLMAAPRKTCVWGLPLMLLSLAVIVISVGFIRTRWFAELAMVALLFSLVLYLGGTKLIRVTWVPIVFLVFAMPVPDRIYTAVAYPLQNLAAATASAFLQAVGVKMEVQAAHMTVYGLSGEPYGLTVAEACSGVRSLMAYLALGVAWAYLESRPVWQRVVLVLCAIPIAILTNVLRVTITCSMFVIDRPELGKDFMHEFTGLIMLVPAVLMFWGLGKLLESLFVEEQEPDEAEESSPSDPSEPVDA
jgi:exosortase